MWFILILSILIILFVVFYIKGKSHEKMMLAEGFANEMMVETVGDYPDSIGDKILDEDALNRQLDDLVPSNTGVESIWTNVRLNNDQVAISSTNGDNKYKTKNNSNTRNEDVNIKINSKNATVVYTDAHNEHNYGGADLKELEGRGSLIDNNGNGGNSENGDNSDNIDRLINNEIDYDNISSGTQSNDYLRRQQKSTGKNKYSNNDINNFRDFFVEPDPAILSPYGFVYMPNTLWSVPQKRPPVCVKDSYCQVQPVSLESPYSPLFEYTGVGSIMPNFVFKEMPLTSSKDKQEYLQMLSQKKRCNPNYFYPGWYGYDEIPSVEVEYGKNADKCCGKKVEY